MGFATLPEEIFSATTATIIYLKRHYPQAKLYVLGTPMMEMELQDAGLTLVIVWESETKDGTYKHKIEDAIASM